MEIFENLSVSSRQEPEELDSYSRTVREVTERLSPAVISVGSTNGRGGGSGVILGTGEGTATAVTNSPVVRGAGAAGGGGGGAGGGAGARGGARARPSPAAVPCAASPLPAVGKAVGPVEEDCGRRLQT